MLSLNAVIRYYRLLFLCSVSSICSNILHSYGVVISVMTSCVQDYYVSDNRAGTPKPQQLSHVTK
jgi:hypothetical protein